jgi:hypothetical protein
VPPAAYDPLRDTDPQETLKALVTNLQAMPSDGSSDVSAQDISKISVGATITITNGFEQIDGGTGLKIAPGTAVTVQIDSGASVAGLQGAGQGAAAIAAAANIQAIHASSAGITVVKDGKPVASINALTIRRGGQVKIDSITLLGEAAEAAESERGLRLLAGAIGGLAQTNGEPFGAAAGIARTAEDHADTPTVVPGIVSGLLESKLQAAFTELLAKQGRTIIPGVDLGSVLGVPGAPVSPK